MGRGKAEPVIAQGNRITVRHCRVLYFNERCEENTKHVIFAVGTTSLSVSIYVAHNFYFLYNLVISEYLCGT